MLVYYSLHSISLAQRICDWAASECVGCSLKLRVRARVAYIRLWATTIEMLASSFCASRLRPAFIFPVLI